ncbi:hypothetical protein GCM10028784_29980 [Myceligenerans cantabricum]
MRTTIATLLRRRRLLVAVLALIGLVAAGLIIARLTSPSATEHSPAPRSSSSPAPSADIPTPAPHRPEPTDTAELNTSDPDEFAAAVAQVLLSWDTTAVDERPDLTLRLLDVADPTGAETPGLLTDLRTWLPDDATWAQLREFETRQWAEIREVIVPAQWSEAVAAAPEGSMAPGITARTVTGALHRAGFWEGEPVARQHDVALTMFLACEPAFDSCRLLRLSAPGQLLH